jgi:hypothetical protein
LPSANLLFAHAPEIAITKAVIIQRQPPAEYGKSAPRFE